MPFSGKGNFKALLLLSACFRIYELLVLSKEAELARNSCVSLRFVCFLSPELCSSNVVWFSILPAWLSIL